MFFPSFPFIHLILPLNKYTLYTQSLDTHFVQITCMNPRFPSNPKNSHIIIFHKLYIKVYY
ncbi:unnamed protein product [Arabidopsis halleri]